MTLFSYVVLIVMAAFLAKTLRKRHRGHLTVIESLFWSTLWVVIAGVAFLPGVLSWLASLVGVGRGVDLLVYLSIIALFYISFKVYDKIHRVEEEITELVRELAIDRADDDD
jgi:hypothetical protein